MKRDTKVFATTLATIFAIIIGISVAFVGPAGIYNNINSWYASAYGSDWLVIQYTADGTVITKWRLNDAAINNESESDGIFFTTPDGVVHLSGHYVYVQNPTAAMERQLLQED